MNDEDRLKKIELLLERMLNDLLIETPTYEDSILPIPTKTFIEMELYIGREITLIGLS